MAPRSSKVLRETDIKTRYSVPTGFLSSLPSFNGGHAVDFQAVDGSGRVWPFRCSIRKKGHLKPVISRGWRAFVDSKHLKVGDKVQFYKKKNEAFFRICSHNIIPFPSIRAPNESSLLAYDSISLPQP